MFIYYADGAAQRGKCILNLLWNNILERTCIIVPMVNYSLFSPVVPFFGIFEVDTPKSVWLGRPRNDTNSPSYNTTVCE